MAKVLSYMKMQLSRDALAIRLATIVKHMSKIHCGLNRSNLHEIIHSPSISPPLLGLQLRRVLNYAVQLNNNQAATRFWSEVRRLSYYVPNPLTRAVATTRLKPSV